ncbi:hypothetical protein FZEAL_6306 [Fusarium zealandicum]|uniref:Zn(2)-C6 fungal-type domain-containing protein n=1 Tax=Fusarium zealandicum TaxID=1053134 RepID=A0A8H4UI02_9HYPO|nr:hypothetical protein FZEAL_6306 [Fusarium zealandicum]
MADLRQACDRCHGKKLRCTKVPGSVVCGRCVKAGVSCIFSPPTRSLRQYDGASVAAFDWSLLGLDDPALDPIGDSSTDRFLATPPVSDHAEPAPRSQVSQLTDIMASLDRLQHEFPTAARHHVAPHQLEDFAQSASAKFDLQSTLEHLLQSAQKLGHLYPEILKQLQPEDESCDIPDCLHSMRHVIQARPRLAFDQALVNLLLACHLRLLDLFDNLVDHARVCAHVASLLPRDHEPRFDIPEIRIGSFVAPKASAASMMTSMVIELQSSLTTRAQELHHVVSSIDGSESREAKILALQCESLKEHASATLADLHSLRERLVKMGLIG